MASTSVTPSVQSKSKRVLVLYVPKDSGDDQLAEKGANFFTTQLGGVTGLGVAAQPKPTVILLGQAIAASKLAAEFLRDTGTILIIGHGSAVYNAVNNDGFFTFLKAFDKDVLQSLIFISCEIDKQHDDLKGFEANIISLLVKSLSSSGSHLKVYASKTDVNFVILKAVHFVWMHSPETHLVPVLDSGVVRKNPQAKDVEDSMDVFSSN